MNEKVEASVLAWQKLAEAREILEKYSLNNDEEFSKIYNKLEKVMIRLNGKFNIRDLAEVLNKEVP